MVARFSLLSLPLALLSLAFPSSGHPDVSRTHLARQSTNSSGSTGDSQCVTYMCIDAVKTDSTVQYTLKSQQAAKLGWMAMGFGSQMADSPMVIMWGNSDGTITLSQRQASAEVMPTVVSNPPRTATLDNSTSSVSGNGGQFVYTIPANTDTNQDVIWAFGTTNPGDKAADATLVQHLDSGTFTLDLTKSLSSSSGNSTSSGSGSSSGSSSGSPPFQTYEKYIIAHAVFVSLGFLILLPFGALLARWLRTFWPGWFAAHWIVQFAVAMPVIVIGIALGITSVSKMPGDHLDDDHKKWGVAIFVLYFAQCALGGFIHFVKSKGVSARPPQNYLHAAFGIAIIALAFYEVHLGYDHEWPLMTGRGDVPKAVSVVYVIWLVLMPVLYLAGLSLLRRQYRLERSHSEAHRLQSTSELKPM